VAFAAVAISLLLGRGRKPIARDAAGMTPAVATFLED
jgi:hypothetical protein